MQLYRFAVLATVWTLIVCSAHGHMQRQEMPGSIEDAPVLSRQKIADLAASLPSLSLMLANILQQQQTPAYGPPTPNANPNYNNLAGGQVSLATAISTLTMPQANSGAVPYANAYARPTPSPYVVGATMPPYPYHMSQNVGSVGYAASAKPPTTSASASTAPMTAPAVPRPVQTYSVYLAGQNQPVTYSPPSASTYPTVPIRAPVSDLYSYYSEYLNQTANAI